MNIIKKITKEVLLAPIRVIEGALEAFDEVVYGSSEPKKKK